MDASETLPCPVCGWDIPAYRGAPQGWEYCDCCSTQFAVTDDQVMIAENVTLAVAWLRLRQGWVAAGCPWTGPDPAPSGWDGQEQLARLLNGESRSR